MTDTGYQAVHRKTVCQAESLGEGYTRLSLVLRAMICLRQDGQWRVIGIVKEGRCQLLKTRSLISILEFSNSLIAREWLTRVHQLEFADNI